MAAVAVVTVQKELFKNMAEILLEAQAAGKLISERPGREKEEGEETPQQFPGWGWDIAGSGDRGSSGAVPFYKLLWGLLCCPPRGQCPPECLDLEREELGGELNKRMNE